MASNQKKRCACPSFAAVPTQVEPTTNRICVRTRSNSPSGFLRDSLRVSTFCSARSRSVVTTIGYVDLVLAIRFFRRRRDVAKFAVSNFPAGVSDVTAESQSYRTQQNHGYDQWRSGTRPFPRRDQRDRAQRRQPIEKPNAIFAAVTMFIEPGLAGFVGHRKHAIVSLFAKLINWPGRRCTHQHNDQRHDLRAAASQKKCDEQSEQSHRQAVDRQRIDQDVDVLRLAEVAQNRVDHDFTKFSNAKSRFNFSARECRLLATFVCLPNTERIFSNR